MGSLVFTNDVHVGTMSSVEIANSIWGNAYWAHGELRGCNDAVISESERTNSPLRILTHDLAARDRFLGTSERA